MISFDQILAAARAELRSARRLVRTWMFTAVALLIALVGYGQQVFFHAIGSGISTTVGAIMTPRFVVVQMGSQMLWVLMGALVFLAFDIRARDQRERMHEVLDARPIDNFSALFGRMIGLVLVGWLPLVAVAVIVYSLTAIAELAGAWISPSIEPLSMAALLLVDAPVTLALWCAVVMLLAVVVRNRLAVAVLALALLGGYIYAFFRVPTYLVGSFAAIGDISGFPSDLAPVFLSWPSVAVRACFLAMAVGLLALAAVLHPRPDSVRRGPHLIAGGVLTVLGAAGLANVAFGLMGDLEERDAWAAVHAEAKDAPRADLRALVGSVAVDPGDELAIDIEATLVAPPEATDELVFSLNPGLTINELRLDGAVAEFVFEAGLLTIRRPTAGVANGEFKLAVQASGVPDPRFAYFDAAFDPQTLRPVEGGAVYLLGIANALFHDDYVALMPAIRWLPMPGAHVGANEQDRGRDFFTMDIEVEVPEGWLAAAPGRRQIVETSGESDAVRMRFNPGAPVTEFGVFAAPFERLATEIDGVVLELLVSPKHLDNLLYFADAAEELETRLAEVLDTAARLGLPYPYDGFSMVEVPMGLRSYGGGWRMDSALGLPGIMLMPEAGLPLAEFGFHFQNPDGYEGEAEEGGSLAKAKVERLEDALQNDFGGGNPFLGATRSFFSYQTGATGQGAAALDAMLLQMTQRLIMDRQGYFSGHGLQAQLSTAMGQVIISAFAEQANATIASIRNAATNRPAVWDQALGNALADLDVWSEPELAVNAIALKTGAVYQTILESLGRERTGVLLAELRRRYAGANFTAQDFAALASELGSDLQPVVGDWLFETAMPGYLVSTVRGHRLPDSAVGEPRYQFLVDVRNDEPAPGVFWLVGTLGPDQGRGTGPLRIPGSTSMEVGLVTNARPRELRLDFFMALNRQALALALPEIDDAEIVEGEPFTGVRPSAWLPESGDDIVIDDLDPGFRVEYDEGAAPASAPGFAIAMGAFPEADLDEGLPQLGPFTRGGGTWSRQQHPGAWGKYRHTVARAGIGLANARATFAAELPHEGRWRLDYHMPREGAVDPQSARVTRVTVSVGGTSDVSFGGARIGDQGAYDMALVVDAERQAIEFDGGVAEGGWNRLGEFDIADRRVEVVIANQADPGNVVVADAVRWRPIAQP